MSTYLLLGAKKVNQLIVRRHGGGGRIGWPRDNAWNGLVKETGELVIK